MGSKNKLVCGVGKNDSDYNLHKFEIVNGVYRRIWICPFYQSWKDMLERCYSDNFHSRSPTYKECSVHEKWHVFSNFKSWMEKCDWHGMCLDKDLLFPGNKVYGPSTCIFISNALNNFLGDCRKARGKYKIGVSWHKRTSSFRADCMNPFSGRKESLGHFTCEDAAHEAWRRRKHQLACMYADIQEDQRVADALRKRYAAKVEEI